MNSGAVSKQGGYFSDRRIRIALWIAAIEGLLVIVNVVPEWAVFVVAVLAVGFWVVLGRTYRSQAIRQASWVLAVSQVLVVLVPLMFIFFKTVAYVVVAILAVAALFYLFGDRHSA
jgi:hypothetical protein